MIVFPQSTRTAQFQPEEFNSIGVKLAKKAEVPIIPVAIKTDFWGNGKIIKDFGKINRDKDVYIEFGEPLQVEGSGKETHTKIIEFIQKKLKEWETH
jgi:1-acyl-sn-glycerol-3-phosphate acyltransferase